MIFSNLTQNSTKNEIKICKLFLLSVILLYQKQYTMKILKTFWSVITEDKETKTLYISLLILMISLLIFLIN